MEPYEELIHPKAHSPPRSDDLRGPVKAFWSLIGSETDRNTSSTGTDGWDGRREGEVGKLGGEAQRARFREHNCILELAY